MKIIIHTLVFTLFLSVCVFAQNNDRVEAGIDIGTGFRSNSWAPSVLYHEDASLGRLSWLRAGLGIRAWGYYGEATNLMSQAVAPSANLLEYRRISTNGVSFVASVSVKVGRIDIGANTDIIGASFGSNRRANYPGNANSPGSGSAYYDQWVATRPVIFNALPLFLNNYNGQSEIYARIRLTRGAGVKIGYTFGQLAYVTKNNDGKVLLDNRERRFSSRYEMPYVALTFRILQ
ncbi:hypothetical protein [Dyadobacter sp. CY312]|uniref:hypothetical protein n=1 Tax=Dyadobacter sp. CY312 TaxID=2907303 RepID=UPI001F3252BC|nr:hypothetical protein [Dyadobacter sp. CY312]MCE7044026.1 hypothetical protein [Dyadobacter sp. CY312]